MTLASWLTAISILQGEPWYASWVPITRPWISFAGVELPKYSLKHQGSAILPSLLAHVLNHTRTTPDPPESTRADQNPNPSLRISFATGYVFKLQQKP